MSSARASNRRRVKETSSDSLIGLGSDKKKRQRDGGDLDDFDPDLDLSSDIKGILSALQTIRQKAQKDGQKKSEETIGSVASEVRNMLDDAKSKFEKERQTFLKSLSKTSKECENSLKNEYAKYQETHDKFCKEKAAFQQCFKELFTKFEDEKEKLFVRYEQQRKKEKNTLAELEKTCNEKIANAEESLRKKKQDDKSISMLRKSLGSFFDGGSDDDFGPDD
ncbi:hypothetical protein LUZ60_013695 [Juncus effusus]|nr:hypothetical protein LUZ60_013695 [Juncus effusus]